MVIDEELTFRLISLIQKKNGAWPSGKAMGFGPITRRFESFRPRPNPSETKDSYLFKF